MMPNIPTKVSNCEAVLRASSVKTSRKVLVSLTILVRWAPDFERLWKARESRWRWAKSRLRKV
jgi:hypothetical protein